MKIAIISDYNNKTGVGSQNYNLYLGLKRLGVAVDIINLVSPQGFKSPPSYGINIISSIFNNPALSFGYGVFFKFPKMLKELLNKNRYDVVILGHQGLAYLYKPLSTLTINLMIIVDDLFPLYKSVYAGLNYLIYRRFLLNHLSEFKNMVFISNFTKNDYIKFYHNLSEKHYKTVYIGIDNMDISHNMQNDVISKFNLQKKRIILNVGSEDKRKNIETFLGVANHYKYEKNLIFVRVGRKSKESDSYITKNKLKNVLYVSGLAEKELMALYKVSNIVISPALLEGYGKQIFEGYLYHNFVITTKVSDVAQMFENDQNVFLVENPKSIKEYVGYIDTICKKNLVFHYDTKIQSIDSEAQEYLDFIKRI